MNLRTLFILTAAALLGFAGHVESQAPAQAGTSLQILQKMKADNQALLDKQTALLLKLDDLQKEASQIKFLTKRG